MIFGPNTKNLITGSLMRAMMFPTGPGENYADAYNHQPRCNFNVTVYSGTQPTAAQIVANWAQYNSTGGLVLSHHTEPKFNQPADSNLLQMAPQIYSPVTPAQAGVATWAIIWGAINAQRTGNINGNDNLTPIDITSVTLPMDRFIVVPVSDELGSGVVRFSDVNFDPATPVVIADATLGINL